MATNADARNGVAGRNNPKAPVTRYMLMSVEANEIRTRYSILAGLFAWVTLAGFITLPNTFTSLQASNGLKDYKSGEYVQDAIRNLPLLPFAGILCFSGIMGTGILWKKYRANYIWVIRHLFM